MISKTSILKTQEYLFNKEVVKMMKFGRSSKEKIAYLEKENKRRKKLCEEKDSFFMELMSDGMRRGSSLAAKHMADRREYLKRK